MGWIMMYPNHKWEMMAEFWATYELFGSKRMLKQPKYLDLTESLGADPIPSTGLSSTPGTRFSDTAISQLTLLILPIIEINHNEAVKWSVGIFWGYWCSRGCEGLGAFQMGLQVGLVSSHCARFESHHA